VNEKERNKGIWRGGEHCFEGRRELEVLEEG